MSRRTYLQCFAGVALVGGALFLTDWLLRQPGLPARYCGSLIGGL
jgi:hypothetical protein